MATKKYVSDSKLQYFWNKIKTYITNAISGKQDTLTAGTNITIANNVISANDEVMIVTLTESNNIITADKTYTEIYNYVTGGGIAFIIDGSDVYYLKQCDANGVSFYRTYVEENEIWNSEYFISNTDDVSYIESDSLIINDYATQEDIVTMLSVLGINTYILDNDKYEECEEA